MFGHFSALCVKELKMYSEQKPKYEKEQEDIEI